jgi:hypothetical protein
MKTESVVDCLEMGIDEGLNLMKEGSLIGWMHYAVTAWPNDQTKQGMMSLIPVVAAELILQKGTRERKVTLQSIRESVWEGGEFALCANACEKTKGRLKEVLSDPPTYREIKKAWSWVFCVRSGMVMNIQALSKQNAESVVRILTHEFDGDPSGEVVRQSKCMTDLWMMVNDKDSDFSKLPECWVGEGRRGLLDRTSSKGLLKSDLGLGIFEDGSSVEETLSKMRRMPKEDQIHNVDLMLVMQGRSERRAKEGADEDEMWVLVNEAKRGFAHVAVRGIK